MTTAIVGPLPDGRFYVETQGSYRVFNDEEEAVEEARLALRIAGGGVIRLLASDGKSLRDEIRVGAAPQQASAPDLLPPSSRRIEEIKLADQLGRTPPANATSDTASAPEQHPGASIPKNFSVPQVPQNFDELLRKGADKAIKSGLKGWWSRRSDNEQIATALIAVALALGPLGEGVFAAAGALFNDEIPTSKQIEALIWLLWITAPLAAFLIVLVWLAWKHVNIYGALVASGIAAVAAAYLVFGSGAPKQLAGVYCYANVQGTGVVYESQCRAFNSAGFIAENAHRTSPSGSANIFFSAFAYTVDARGDLMAFAAIMAGVGVGLLLRENV